MRLNNYIRNTIIRNQEHTCYTHESGFFVVDPFSNLHTSHFFVKANEGYYFYHKMWPQLLLIDKRTPRYNNEG